MSRNRWIEMRRRTWRVAAGTAGLALFSVSPLRAQSTPPPSPWVPTFSADVGFGDYAGGASASQALALNLARPDQYWRVSAGHYRLMGEEAYTTGFSYQRIWDRKYRLGGGVSSGVNESGGLAPKYHLSVTAGMNVIDPLPVSLSFSRRRSARNESYVDRIGLGFTWYAPGPWILGGNAAYSLGHPGSTSSRSAGGSIAFSQWQRMSIGVQVNYGDGSYLFLPADRIIEFKSRSYSVNFSKNLAPETSIRLAVGYSDYYNGSNVSLGYTKRW